MFFGELNADYILSGDIAQEGAIFDFVAEIVRRLEEWIVTKALPFLWRIIKGVGKFFLTILKGITWLPRKIFHFFVHGGASFKEKVNDMADDSITYDKDATYDIPLSAIIGFESANNSMAQLAYYSAMEANEASLEEIKQMLQEDLDYWNTTEQPKRAPVPDDKPLVTPNTDKEYQKIIDEYDEFDRNPSNNLKNPFEGTPDIDKVHVDKQFAKRIEISFTGPLKDVERKTKHETKIAISDIKKQEDTNTASSKSNWFMAAISGFFKAIANFFRWLINKIKDIFRR